MDKCRSSASTPARSQPPFKEQKLGWGGQVGRKLSVQPQTSSPEIREGSASTLFPFVAGAHSHPVRGESPVELRPPRFSGLLPSRVTMCSGVVPLHWDLSFARQAKHHMKTIIIAITIPIAFALWTSTASAESSVPTVIGAKEPYSSGIAEIMIMTQIRHAKLWLAGDVRNWDLADYQIDELKEGLEDVVKHFPQYKDMPVGQMIETIIITPIAEVEKAIKSRDRAKFVSTFDKLTDACNACHRAANRAFIVVQRPAASLFPNQSFAPKRN